MPLAPDLFLSECQMTGNISVKQIALGVNKCLKCILNNWKKEKREKTFLKKTDVVTPWQPPSICIICERDMQCYNFFAASLRRGASSKKHRLALAKLW